MKALQVSVSLPKLIIARLKKDSRLEGLSLSGMIRKIVLKATPPNGSGQ